MLKKRGEISNLCWCWILLSAFTSESPKTCVRVGHDAVRWNPPRYRDRVLRKYIPRFQFVFVCVLPLAQCMMYVCLTAGQSRLVSGSLAGSFGLFCFYIYELEGMLLMWGLFLDSVHFEFVDQNFYAFFFISISMREREREN